MGLLQKIDSPAHLRQLKLDELLTFAQELRDFIIDVVATKEGHLGASLGVVELTIALHYIFDTPHDKLIWDVGHQAYGHKILTGRKDIFGTNRQLNGISGFPKRSESQYDDFGTGHSSTSISAILGMAIASKLKGENSRNHIAVIGDASIASGMAFEGLNHLGVTHVNALIVLNDNAIAAQYLLDTGKASQVLIVDLDVHQGNGTAAIFEQEPRVFTFSMHGGKNYPLHKEASDLDVPLDDGTNGDTYLTLLRNILPRLLDEVQPDFVFFQSGVDVLATDKLGRLGLTIADCRERDRIVLEAAHRNNLPLVASMGGGYSENIKHIVEAHANTYRLAAGLWF